MPDSAVADSRSVDAAPDAHEPIDAAVAGDAPVGSDFSCLGMAPPATAPDPLPVTGSVLSFTNGVAAPVTGATVVLHRRSDDVALAQATSASDGLFMMSVASGGLAIDGYFTTQVAGYRPARADPGVPLTTDSEALVVVVSDAELTRWYAIGSDTYDSTASTLVTIASDCQRHQLTSSTLAVDPTAQVIYDSTTTNDWDAALTTSSNGFALVANVAASVTATVHAASDFPSHAIVAPAGTLTVALVQPYR